MENILREDTWKTRIEKEIARLKSFHNGQETPETFKALAQGCFEGTANLQEELILNRMKIENLEIELNKVKLKINQIIQKINHET